MSRWPKPRQSWFPGKLGGLLRGAGGARETTPEWPQQPFWFRSREPIEDDPVLRACALTFVSRSGHGEHRPSPGCRGAGAGRAASLDHALWLHRPVDPNQWHCYDAGVSHRDARVWRSGPFTTPRARWWRAWRRSRSGGFDPPDKTVVYATGVWGISPHSFGIEGTAT